MEPQKPFPVRLHDPIIKLYRDNQNYSELNLFRESGGPRLFSSAKTRVVIYKLIFASFAAFFLFLSINLFTHSIPFATGILSISESAFLKNLLGAVSSLFSGGALCLAILLRTERDAAAQLMSKLRLQLTRHYHQKRGPKSVKTAYKEALDMMCDHHLETLQTLEHITYSPGMKSSSREHLYNQALLELNHQLSRVVEGFRRDS